MVWSGWSIGSGKSSVRNQPEAGGDRSCGILICLLSPDLRARDNRRFSWGPGRVDPQRPPGAPVSILTGPCKNCPATA